jgi:hypothetical protein
VVKEDTEYQGLRTEHGPDSVNESARLLATPIVGEEGGPHLLPLDEKLNVVWGTV